MKKILTLSMVAILALTACQGNKEAEQKQKQLQQLQDATKEELIQAVAERDELLSLLGDITNDVQEVKRLENIMSASGDINETPDRRRQIQNDITAMQQALQQRRERLAELEAKLQKSTTSNESLRNTIASLRQQIDDQSNEIARLNESLSQMQTQVTQLSSANDSLVNTVSQQNQQIETVETANKELDSQLNEVEYLIRTDKELKELKVEFKKNILQPGYDARAFSKGDRRTLTTIPLYTTKKIEVLPARPQGCYVIDENPKTKEKNLRITNPEIFWGQSKYLVVKIK